MSRRKSTVLTVRNKERNLEGQNHLELERLEQETTLVLQEIDRNLSKANSVITDKIFPVLSRYSAATSNVWQNVSFWKKFYEDASETQVCAEESQIADGTPPQHEQRRPSSGSRTRDKHGMAQTDKVENAAAQNNSTLTSDLHMEASTPEKKSRPLLGTSPQRSIRRGYPRVSISPRKKTPNKYTEAEAKRLSMLQNFLNSSPTLPEPPKLQSELNYSNDSASHENAHGGPDYDLEERRALRLLPIALLPPRALQRLSRTPPVLSSATRERGTRSGSPLKGSVHIDLAKYNRNQELPPSPKIQAFRAHDDSDEVPLPKLQTIQVAGSKRSSDDQSSNKRPRVAINESENVFLDANNDDDTNNNSRNHSAVYNTIKELQQGHEEQGQQQDIDYEQPNRSVSKSMSQLFDDVLNPPAQSAERRASEPPPPSTQQGQADITDTGYATANLPHNSSRHMDNTVDSSELGSFFGERWKALSKSLRRSE